MSASRGKETLPGWKDIIVGLLPILNRDRIHKPLFSSKFTNGPNKLECYITLSWDGLSGTNSQVCWAHLQVTKKKKFCEYDSWYHIHDTSFSTELISVTKKLECYITLSWNGLSGTNTQAYWAHLLITKKIKCCEYDSCYWIYNTSFSPKLIIGPKKLECYITLSWNGLSGTNTQGCWAHLQCCLCFRASDPVNTVTDYIRLFTPVIYAIVLQARHVSLVDTSG
jgi:predicted small integral membrane protein